MPRKTRQHPFLFRLALPSSQTFTQQLFLKVHVWNHACVHVPFCQIPPPRRLSWRKTSRSRMASVICSRRVYCCEQADTSAKQRIVVPISPVRWNGSRLVPCLGNARSASRFPFPAEASKIRCSTDARHQARALDCEQRTIHHEEVFDAGRESPAKRAGATDRFTLSGQSTGAAVLVEGSVARDDADYSSDL